MAIPVRDDGSPGPTKHLVMFVHGFCSSAATWNKLLQLLKSDERLQDRYEFRTFQYETRPMNWSMTRRLPEIDEVGGELRAELDAAFGEPAREAYIDVTLVGHSMGGLVIQSCVKKCLHDGHGLDLRKIRQVILIATPSFGSPIASGLRRILSFLPNTQERILRVFNPRMQEIHEFIRDKVLLARERSRHEYPVPFYSFWGSSDKIVPAAYAKGLFEHGESLPGDHNTVHHPDSVTDRRYTGFYEALTHPHGHTNILEFEDFLFTLKVEPLTPGFEVTATHGTKQRMVQCDNVATVTRKVRFSSHNRSNQPYTLKYGTRNGGWVRATIVPEHVTEPDKLRTYDDHGFDVCYDVCPLPGGEAQLQVVVYKGFDEGHRDLHMHLGRRSYFRRLRYELDLRPYIDAGWKIVEARLHFHPKDLGDHTLCAGRAMVKPDPPSIVDDAGLWKWDLEHVTEGVVDIVWELQPPVLSAGKSTAEQTNG